MKKIYLACILLVLLLSNLSVSATPAPRSYYRLTVYHYKTEAQFNLLSTYLKEAWVPAMHRHGFKQVGVFVTTERDTADKRVYLLVPFDKLEKLQQTEIELANDKIYTSAAKDYLDAIYNNPPYQRMESSILYAWQGMPQPSVTSTVKNADRIYELRSYESATEKYHANKVDMFNAGGEIALFSRLGFRPVFYSSAVAGNHMPNLVYLMAYTDMAEHEKLWKSFGIDPQWKDLSSREEYKNNVSRIESVFLKGVTYSDF